MSDQQSDKQDGYPKRISDHIINTRVVFADQIDWGFGECSCFKNHPLIAFAERGEAGISVRIDETAILVENPRGSDDNTDDGEAVYVAMEE